MVTMLSVDFWKKIFERKILYRFVNKHNRTRCINIYDIHCVSVGRETYGPIDVEMTRSDYNLKIGDFCSIGTNVKFILSSEHPMDRFSTYPICFYFGVEGEDVMAKGDIVLDDDVWIGTGATILSGVHIGQGACVAACSVVTKDVPPYAIVAGNPAKIIKYRFDEATISKLMQIDYKLIDKQFIRENSAMFLRGGITSENVDELLMKLKNKQ